MLHPSVGQKVKRWPARNRHAV